MWFSKIETKKFIKSSYKSRKEIEIDIKKQINDKNNFFLGIYNLKKKHIGNIKFHDFDIKNNSAWLGILIGEKKYRNIGIGYKSIKLSTNFFFKKYNIYKFYLKVNTKNKIAISSYLKSGFKKIKKLNSEIIMELNIFEKKLILGTAQFGKPYGITNLKSRISQNQINKILSFSSKRILEIDTSEDYDLSSKTKEQISDYLLNTKIHAHFF